jgi:hypothetical protein
MIRKFLTTAVAVGAVVAAACSDSPTTAPAPLQRAPAFSPAEHHADNSWRAGAVMCELHPAYVGSAEIGPRGGQIIVGRSRVIVPPGALNRTVRITATMPAGETVEIYFDFEPHGLEFRKPAGLVLDASGCDIPEYYAPNIAYLGENGEILEYIQSYYSNDWHFVAAPIWHFSRYAVAW